MAKKIIAVSLCTAIIIGIAVFGYIFYIGRSGIRINPTYKEGQIKVACVGDSVTYGFGIKNWIKNNYPALLGDILGEKFNVCCFGVSGTTVQKNGDDPYVNTKAYAQSKQYKADIVVFMLGSNDSKPYNFKSTEKLMEEYEALVTEYEKVSPDCKIFLCTPPTAYFPEGKSEGLTSFDIQPLIIEEIAEEIRSFAREKDYSLIDINALTKDNPSLFCGDRVHPNNSGAALIADTISKYISAFI